MGDCPEWAEWPYWERAGWARMDSNHRRRKPTGLQPVSFGHSDTRPIADAPGVAPDASPPQDSTGTRRGQAARQAEQPRAKRRRRGAAVAFGDDPPRIGAEGQGPRKGPAPEARSRGGMVGCGAAPGARRHPPPLICATLATALCPPVRDRIKCALSRAACTTPHSWSDRGRPQPGCGGGGTRLRSAGYPRAGWGQPGSDCRAPGAIATPVASVRVTGGSASRKRVTRHSETRSWKPRSGEESGLGAKRRCGRTRRRLGIVARCLAALGTTRAPTILTLTPLGRRRRSPSVPAGCDPGFSILGFGLGSGTLRPGRP